LSWDSKRGAAVFFVARGGSDVTLESLLQLAGASSIASRPDIEDDPSGLRYCSWAGLSCEAHVIERTYHHVLAIYFWISDFLEMMPEGDEEVPLEEDRALPLASAFKRACEALEPEAAFLLTKEWQSDPDYFLARELQVSIKDADALADEPFGMLYLNDDISRYWTPDPRRDDRESLPVPRGRLVFRGRGGERWF